MHAIMALINYIKYQLISRNQSALSSVIYRQMNTFNHNSKVSFEMPFSILTQHNNKDLEFEYATLLARKQMHISYQIQMQALLRQYQLFKDQCLTTMNSSLEKVLQMCFQKTKDKSRVDGELDKSKENQRIMKLEVIQLKEMISEFIANYNKEIQAKNQEIYQLKAVIKNIEEIKASNSLNQHESHEKEYINEGSKCDLQIIQEESSNATGSEYATSMREHEIKSNMSTPLQIQNSKNTATMNEIENQIFLATPSNKQNQSIEEVSALIDNKNQHKRTKSFLDHFRKTIVESFSQSKKEIIDVKTCHALQINHNFSNVPLTHTAINHAKPIMTDHNKSTITDKQNYQEIKYYSHCLKEKPSQELIPGFRTIYVNAESEKMSKSSSNSDLTILIQNDQINIPLKLDSPKNMMFLKKKQHQHFKMMTEPSPERVNHFEKQTLNHFFSTKQTPSQPKIFQKKRYSHEKSLSTDNKSGKSSTSKEKIKVTLKMIQEINQYTNKNINHISGNNSKLNNKNSKVLVHLGGVGGGGGKSLLKRFLVELKQAIRKFVIWVGCYQDEVKYEGQKRNGMRWGRGKLYYKNGIVYDGQFRENTRHGHGIFILNGITIFEGEMHLDHIQGQGYLKSLKFMSGNNSCSSLLMDASYCGYLSEDKMHGMGTLFMNQKQKIVTKFNYGSPTGDFTYYTMHQIQFGVWPID